MPLATDIGNRLAALREDFVKATANEKPTGEDLEKAQKMHVDLRRSKRSIRGHASLTKQPSRQRPQLRLTRSRPKRIRRSSRPCLLAAMATAMVRRMAAALIRKRCRAMHFTNGLHHFSQSRRVIASLNRMFISACEAGASPGRELHD